MDVDRAKLLPELLSDLQEPEMNWAHFAPILRILSSPPLQ